MNDQPVIFEDNELELIAIAVQSLFRTGSLRGDPEQMLEYSTLAVNILRKIEVVTGKVRNQEDFGL
jgi:hypothetical protein